MERRGVRSERRWVGEVDGRRRMYSDTQGALAGRVTRRIARAEGVAVAPATGPRGAAGTGMRAVRWRREVWRGMTGGGLERRRLAFTRTRTEVEERWSAEDWRIDSEDERVEAEEKGDG